MKNEDITDISREYVPVNLWIREDQMARITKEAYDRSITIYSLIRKTIDFYYEHKDDNKDE